ncbi:hypothetical protein COCON_G00056850 [Conger conger]|uniref:ADAM10 endopeptidase n=1 Tax=Conger conger TaxID=82655 RepID=A0A9Q1DQS1_CONCO|nr:disintegrin and metalloproteinase domain-containing protein 10 [Conger conger]XP_061093706.1 disintegrin and metalloproteinase domain-containing protein 10 [Conger conger]KAJ8278619.1 hypothetical protein COCON_G00056850 [Conger conger]
MRAVWCGLLVTLWCSSGPSAGALDSISPFIRHYEGLSYDREAVHRKHQRAKRETSPHRQVVPLDFRAFNRNFSLRLKRDMAAFADNFEVNVKEAAGVVDLSHIYSGQLEDDGRSSCHGTILQGQFEGTIETANGTYFVEPMSRYSTSQTDHSVIYHEDDIDDLDEGRAHGGFCGAERLKHFAQRLKQAEADQEEVVSRARRTVDNSKTTCLLHFYADDRYFKRFGSVEAVIGQVSSYIRAVNDIYDKVDFEGIKLINFKVRWLKVMPDRDASSPLSQTLVGPEKLLGLYSQMNWGNYCLSYLLTDRDYSGVLGLAWEGKPGMWGGICSPYKNVPDMGHSTLNTGLITLQNFGEYLPPRLVQLTLAHELGHSLGAPHDEGRNCGNMGSSGGKGRFLMFPQATDEVLENNDKFSPCSIKSISHLLRIKKDECFVKSDGPICGNQIVEEGEACDVGQNDMDPCCYSAKEPSGVQCNLKPDKLCSPSQGPCCNGRCVFKPYGAFCEEETECQLTSTCSGTMAACPPPGAKPNLTTCARDTRVCLNGECVQSLCLKYGLQQCDCSEVSSTGKCYLCCQQPGKPKTCASTTSSIMTKYFQGASVPLVAGAPCYNKQGYCDMFKVCRVLDADGPIARLKNSFLHLNEFDNLADWMEAYWWLILLTICGVAAVMACIICLCGRTLETDKDK